MPQFNSPNGQPLDLESLPQRSNKTIALAILGFFAVSFLLATILAFVYNNVFFIRRKQKPRIIFLGLLIFGILLWVYGQITSPFHDIIAAFGSMPESLLLLIHPYIYLCLWISIFLGAMIIVYHNSQIKRYPALRQLEGWAKGFVFDSTPFEKLKRKRMIKQIKAGELQAREFAPLGVNDGLVYHNAMPEGIPKITEEFVVRYYSEATTHSLITGASGSGKSISMLTMVYNDILTGKPVLFMDNKKSPEVIYFLSKWAHEHNRPFYHFTNSSAKSYKNPYCKSPASYDPLATGTANSKADMILGLRSWEGGAEIYKKRTQDVLGSVFMLLARIPPSKVPDIDWDSGGIHKFASALRTANLLKLIEVFGEYEHKLNDEDKKRLLQLTELYEEIKNPKSPLRDQIRELQSICRTLIMSEYGGWLIKQRNHIDLLKIALDENNEGPVCLFSFNPQEEPDFAKYMGEIVLADLGRVSAVKNAQGNQTLFGLYIDEFQTLNPDSIKDILEKARSAKFFVTLSLQSYEQIIKAADSQGEATLNAILDTCSNFVAHAGATTHAAEILSAIVGKYNKTEYTSTTRMSSHLFALNFFNVRNAVVSTSIKEDWIVPPHEFQRLESPSKANGYKSSAFVINKACQEPNYDWIAGAVARRTQVIAREDLLGGVPDDFRKALAGKVSEQIDSHNIEDEDVKWETTEETFEEANDVLSEEAVEVKKPALVKPLAKSPSQAMPTIDSVSGGLPGLSELPDLVSVDNGNEPAILSNRLLAPKKKTSFEEMRALNKNKNKPQ
jgi:hypothetical protein